MPYTVTPEEYSNRLELVAARVTLNGKPAAISGARLPYAVVRTTDLQQSVDLHGLQSRGSLRRAELFDHD